MGRLTSLIVNGVKSALSYDRSPSTHPGGVDQPPENVTTIHIGGPDPEMSKPLDRYRTLIESFDEDREDIIGKLVRIFFLMCAYIGPIVVAYAMGKELGDEYSGPFSFNNGWSFGTHCVAYFGEMAIAMITLASATALRRYKSDKEYIPRLILALIALVIFSLASGLAQWYVAFHHVAPTTSEGYVSLLFRVIMVPCVDIASLLYIAIMSYKSLKKFLAEQTQKADAIEALNGAEIRIEQAQEEAERKRRENEQYLSSKQAREEVLLRIEEIQAQAMIQSAERALLPPIREVNSDNGRQLRG